MGGFCSRWPEDCLCAPLAITGGALQSAGPTSPTKDSRESPSSLSLESAGVLTLKFILCPEAAILILVFYNPC